MVDRTLDGMGAAAWFAGIREAVLEEVDGDRISLDDLTDRLVEDGWPGSRPEISSSSAGTAARSTSTSRPPMSGRKPR